MPVPESNNEFLQGADVLAAAARLVASARTPVRVAVSYVGRTAPDILPLKNKDTIVVNGSDNAVGSGATDPRAVQEWLGRGVRVVNHPWLHAKVFVAGGTAIVGSANLSERAGSAWPQDSFRPGDMVVMLGLRTARLVEFRGSGFVPGYRRKRSVAVYRRDRQLRSVKIADVRQALESVGTAMPSHDAPAGNWLNATAERAAVLDLWQLLDPGAP